MMHSSVCLCALICGVCDVDRTVVLLLSVQTAKVRVVKEAFGCWSALHLGFFFFVVFYI